MNQRYSEKRKEKEKSKLAQLWSKTTVYQQFANGNFIIDILNLHCKEILNPSLNNSWMGMKERHVFQCVQIQLDLNSAQVR